MSPAVPFTVSHAIAVLPLAAGRPGRRLWPAALVIGSMVPDLPYFVPPHRGSVWSHAASGPVTIDLVLGLLVFALWQLVLRRPLVDLAPPWVAARLPPPRALTAYGWGWAALSVLIGALTHVVWDTFTHRGRWGTDHLTALNLTVGPLPAYRWLQYGSGVLGLLGLAVFVAGWLRRRPPGPVTTLLPAPGRRVAWGLVVVTFAAGLVGTWGPAVLAGEAFAETAVVQVATGTITVTGAAVVVVCLGWQLWRALGSDHRVVGQRPPDGGHG